MSYSWGVQGFLFQIKIGRIIKTCVPQFHKNHSLVFLYLLVQISAGGLYSRLAHKCSHCLILQLVWQVDKTSLCPCPKCPALKTIWNPEHIFFYLASCF